MDIAAITTKRPGLDRINQDTNEAISCYYGGHPLQSYIEKFSTEEDAIKYQWRVNATIDSYDNYPQQILEKYIESIERAGQITRATNNKYLDEELTYRYERWVCEELQPFSLLLPELYVQLALPKSEVKPLTIQDQKDNKLVPYPVTVFPNYVIAFEQNLDGSLKWITIQPDSTKDIYEHYDNLYKYDIEGVTVKKSEPHGFDQVPFVRILWRENKSIQGLPKPGYPFMYTVTKKTLSALRYSTMLIENGQFHLFPKLVMGDRTWESMQKNGMGASGAIKESASPDSASVTRYLQMPDTEMELLDKILHERIPESIYRAARLVDRSTTKVQSGISKSLDMVPELSVIAKIAGYFEEAEEQIISIIASVFPSTTVNVEYPKSFDIKTTAEAIADYAEVMKAIDDTSLPQSETGNRLIAQDIYKRALPNATDEELAVINKEIDEAVLEPDAQSNINTTELGKLNTQQPE